MINYQQEPNVFIEGESKRIGRVSLPDFLFSKMENSMQLFIHLPIDVRVENILEEYQPWHKPELFKEAFRFIKKRIHTPIANQIEVDLETGNFASATKLLLEHYCDPRYEHSIKHYPEHRKIVINAENIDEAFESVLGKIGDETVEDIKSWGACHSPIL